MVVNSTSRLRDGSAIFQGLHSTLSCGRGWGAGAGARGGCCCGGRRGAASNGVAARTEQPPRWLPASTLNGTPDPGAACWNPSRSRQRAAPHLLHARPVDLPQQRENERLLARSGRPVEQGVRAVAGGHLQAAGGSGRPMQPLSTSCPSLRPIRTAAWCRTGNHCCLGPQCWGQRLPAGGSHQLLEVVCNVLVQDKLVQGPGAVLRGAGKSTVKQGPTLASAQASPLHAGSLGGLPCPRSAWLRAPSAAGQGSGLIKVRNDRRGATRRQLHLDQNASSSSTRPGKRPGLFVQAHDSRPSRSSRIGATSSKRCAQTPTHLHTALHLEILHFVSAHQLGPCHLPCLAPCALDSAPH